MMTSNRTSMYNGSLYHIDLAMQLLKNISLHDEQERKWLTEKANELIKSINEIKKG